MINPIERPELLEIAERLESLTAYIHEFAGIELHAEATLGREWARAFLLAKQAERDLKRLILQTATGQVERVLGGG